ncbi:cytochrome [Sesamum angolense]|uniref:Cytochrome n=1 Tax=Sesamum angolense TaxID=2727404 RepID=A0AAE2BKR1_9LAMI|nr:cytochrome [Sesamum angolense]
MLPTPALSLALSPPPLPLHLPPPSPLFLLFVPSSSRCHYPPPPPVPRSAKIRSLGPRLPFLLPCPKSSSPPCPFSSYRPLSQHLPTKRNRKIWALEKEISALILKVVKERRQAGYERDLLQTLLEGAKSSYSTSSAIDQFIVDNCRNIYLAGFETSAVSASWCLMLLASNPEWQTRVRDEAEEFCQGRIPDIDMLRKMKQLHMVIQETMRLYPPAPTLAREAFKDVKIGNIRVPKGVIVWTMVTALHTDTALWGADALEFNPKRFENGISGACKSPNAYMPFGFGQRVCVGQHLAMVELKLLMALILTNFSFTLSPNYVHSPVMKMIIEPKHGVQIMVKKL